MLIVIREQLNLSASCKIKKLMNKYKNKKVYNNNGMPSTSLFYLIVVYSWFSLIPTNFLRSRIESSGLLDILYFDLKHTLKVAQESTVIFIEIVDWKCGT